MVLTWCTTPNRAANSTNSFPIFSRFAASGPMLSTISPLRTYSTGTRVSASTITEMYGV